MIFDGTSLPSSTAALSVDFQVSYMSHPNLVYFRYILFVDLVISAPKMLPHGCRAPAARARARSYTMLAHDALYPTLPHRDVEASQGPEDPRTAVALVARVVSLANL